MSYIETTPPEQASGDVDRMYRRLQGSAVQLPNYARVFCHRPGLMAAWVEMQAEVRGQLAERTYLLANLSAARSGGSSYCALAFASRLLAGHYSEQELLAILGETDASPLSAAEQAVWTLAGQVASDSSEVSQKQVDALRRAGCSDSTVFDIVATAAARCFFSRIPDALGVRPDAHYRDLSPALRRLLVVGRDIELNNSRRQTADRPGQQYQADYKGEPQ